MDVNFLKYEDFKHSVKLPCPHNGPAVRGWCYEQKIHFTYNTANIPAYVEYKMINEADATWFALRWLWKL